MINSTSGLGSFFNNINIEDSKKLDLLEKSGVKQQNIVAIKIPRNLEKNQNCIICDPSELFADDLEEFKKDISDFVLKGLEILEKDKSPRYKVHHDNIDKIRGLIPYRQKGDKLIKLKEFNIEAFTFKEYLRFHSIVSKSLETYIKQLKKLREKQIKEDEKREKEKSKLKKGFIKTLGGKELKIILKKDAKMKGTNIFENVKEQQKLNEIAYEEERLKNERREKKDEFLKDIQTIKEDIKESKEQRKKEDLEADIQQEQIDKTK